MLALAAAVVAGLLGRGACGLGHAATDTPGVTWPPLADLSARLRSELPSIPLPDASHTNAEAYTRTLAPWVLAPEEPGVVPAPETPILKTNLYPGAAGYLRIGTIAGPLRPALRAAMLELRQTGPLYGLIVDLRFAGGSDLGAGIEAASEFAAPRRSVDFQLGDTHWTARHEAGNDAFPILVLVNRQTRQAAEAFAAALRAVAAKPLVLGSPTAGQARRYRPVSVSDSLVLQVAAESLRLPDGAEFPTSGLEPNLKLQVPESDERAYAIDEYRRVVGGRARVSSGPGRLNEAELVRRRRLPRSPFEDAHEGHATSRRDAIRGGGAEEGTSLEAAPRSVQDPALALALDLIAGAAEDGTVSSPDAVPPGDSR